MIMNFDDYRDILRAELARRCQADRSYSMRMFAEALELSPSRLSEVFSGKQGLSREVAFKISKKLEFNSQEESYFADLVESEHARSAEKRMLAKLRVQEREVDREYKTLQIDHFQVISEWHHFAIFQLCELPHFAESAKWIAEKLQIRPEQAQDAITRLLRLNVLERTASGKLKSSQQFIATGDDTPSDAIKQFHRQILEKAISAITQQSVERRNFSANVIAIDSKKLPEAKEMMKRFRRRFSKEMTASAKCDSVYCLSMQFFELTHPEKEGLN